MGTLVTAIAVIWLIIAMGGSHRSERTLKAKRRRHPYIDWRSAMAHRESLAAGTFVMLAIGVALLVLDLLAIATIPGWILMPMLAASLSATWWLAKESNRAFDRQLDLFERQLEAERLRAQEQERAFQQQVAEKERLARQAAARERRRAEQQEAEARQRRDAAEARRRADEAVKQQLREAMANAARLRRMAEEEARAARAAAEQRLAEEATDADGSCTFDESDFADAMKNAFGSDWQDNLDRVNRRVREEEERLRKQQEAQRDEERRQAERARSPLGQKLAKLRAVMNDRAATANEKDNARRLHDKLTKQQAA